MKRFTDTDIWKKSWFLELTAAEKVAWVYLNDNCNDNGVWDINYRLADYLIGERINWEGFAKKCGDNIKIEKGKWVLTNFCAIPRKKVVHRLLTTYPQANIIIDYFNHVTGQKRRYSKTSLKPIVARMNEGFTLDQMKQVILDKYNAWNNDETMQQYITIETLFRPSHFEKYLNQRKTRKIPEKGAVRRYVPEEEITEEERAEGEKLLRQAGGVEAIMKRALENKKVDKK